MNCYFRKANEESYQSKRGLYSSVPIVDAARGLCAVRHYYTAILAEDRGSGADVFDFGIRDGDLWERDAGDDPE